MTIIAVYLRMFSAQIGNMFISNLISSCMTVDAIIACSGSMLFKSGNPFAQFRCLRIVLSHRLLRSRMALKAQSVYLSACTLEADIVTSGARLFLVLLQCKSDQIMIYARFINSRSCTRCIVHDMASIATAYHSGVTAFVDSSLPPDIFVANNAFCIRNAR